LVLTAVAVALSGCGGGGTSPQPSGSGNLTGDAVKGPVAGATITAYAVSPNGTPGPMLGSTVTDARGAFTVPIDGAGGPVLVRMNGGTYTDEATGATMSMGNSDAMTAAVPSVAAGASITGVQITPLTSMAESMAEHMSGGLTNANVMAANAAVGAYFMVDDIVYTRPMNPLLPASGSTATQSMMNYGMTLAAMSQYAKSAGMAQSSALVTSMMADASDGVMDGMAGGNPIMMGSMTGSGMGGVAMRPDAGTIGLSDAMGSFLVSGFNMSGVTRTSMAGLMQHLAGSGGHVH
jgi:hypothetical protein